MITKKTTAKASQPSTKTVEKQVSSPAPKQEKVPVAVWTKVQTAEGWKRMMKKAHPKK